MGLDRRRGDRRYEYPGRLGLDMNSNFVINHSLLAYCKLRILESGSCPSARER